MRFHIAVCLALISFSAATYAAPQLHLPQFTRANAEARLASIASARAASSAECVDCEEVLGEVIHEAIGNTP